MVDFATRRVGLESRSGAHNNKNVLEKDIRRPEVVHRKTGGAVSAGDGVFRFGDRPGALQIQGSLEWRAEAPI